ncbi:hypothetical protein Ddye_017006 [Dipteronia dyeriana]|uniref:DDE Tnp4 domain-containing protein n=1 Tax=Dipteronia dyeriana TaxID=168575 RepID=A0AAD9X0T0_9ROSI|nr:hypothetical protein Ddye_017006 [Dipteronia dyeriana]
MDSIFLLHMMYRGNDLEDEEMNHVEMSEEEDTKIDEEFYEAIKILVMAVQAVYRMYPDVFRKLCNILREKTRLEDTRFICVEQILGQFLQIVVQNHRYCVIHNNFRRSQFATSEIFHKILKALNTLSKDMMAKPGLVVPAKIRENTKFFSYFKDCIGAIDGTHIPATVMGHDNSRFRDRHGNISQNILAACNFDLEFMYVLAGWEGSTHDSKLLSDALSMRNGLKVPQAPPFPFKTQVEIVLTCVALHNFLRKECRSDEFPIEEESTSSSSSPIVKEELEELVSQTQEQ